MLKRMALNIIVFFIAFFLNNFYITCSEVIFYNEGSSIIFINIEGRMQRRVEVPFPMYSDFTVKKDTICFISKDRTIHWYNWKKKKEIQLIQGPFVYSGNGYGPEIYKNIDFSVKDEIITFDVRPEYVIDMPDDINAKKYYYDELFDLSEILMINLNENKMTKITYKGGNWKPLVYKKKILYQEAVSLIVFDIDKGTRINLNRLYTGHTKSDESTTRLGLGLIRIIDDSVIFFEYDYDDIKIKKIIEFNFLKNEFKILYNFANRTEKRNIYLNSISDISSDKKKLMFVEDNSKIYYFDLNQSKIQLIKETKIKFLKAKFVVAVACRSPLIDPIGKFNKIRQTFHQCGF